jgi:hypothetical protein
VVQRGVSIQAGSEVFFSSTGAQRKKQSRKVEMKCLLAPSVFRTVLYVIACSSLAATGQQTPGRREFARGAINGVEDLPASRLRARIEALPAAARARAISRLHNFHFTDLDLNSLEVDQDGSVYYADSFSVEPTTTNSASEPSVGLGAVPINPFPAGLVFHSRPGAPNVLFLNFSGETVTGTAWNNSLGRTTIPAMPFSTDGDSSTFSDAEQKAIKGIWERVSEDYAPFNVDVTTEWPATFSTRVAEALITRNTDANGDPNPSSGSGGVAYIDVFAGIGFSSYRPAWIYHNNLGNAETFIAEATAHELGHNLGLSHDGQTSGIAYYRGHGSDETSWAPIMGVSYYRNVTQWSKGEYYLANNTQDDLATIAAKLSYRADDHGDTSATAEPLIINGGSNIVSTTPETDPSNSNHGNKGVLERNTDVDVFFFTTGSGRVSLTVNPWTMPSGTQGGNLDVVLELHDAADNVIATSDSATETGAQIETTLGEGLYYLFIRNTGVGDPLSSTPTGYTSYASLGQYFISGYITSPAGRANSFALTATVNNSAWGTVSPASALYGAGETAQVVASAGSYYRFLGWTNGASGSNNPLSLTITSNTVVEAVFDEILTSNFATPYSWLAANGYSNDFETAVASIGANGMPVWQSYVAGFNPKDPSAQLRLALTHAVSGADVLNWSTSSGRMYTLWSSTNLSVPFTRVAGASNLPSTVHSFTNAVASGSSVFYRLEVQKP